MKKRILIIVLSIIVIVALLWVIGYKVNNNIKQIELANNQKRYEEIKKDVETEIKRYTSVVSPICKDNNSELLITHETLVYNGGFDKEKLLDIDNKSYCSVYALSRCNGSEELDYDIYLKCNNYEDDGFKQWVEDFKPKK